MVFEAAIGETYEVPQLGAMDGTGIARWSACSSHADARRRRPPGLPRHPQDARLWSAHRASHAAWFTVRFSFLFSPLPSFPSIRLSSLFLAQAGQISCAGLFHVHPVLPAAHNPPAGKEVILRATEHEGYRAAHPGASDHLLIVLFNIVHFSSSGV